jgi:soluble P-type ATPase
MLVVSVPGDDELRLRHLILDANGTLTDRGRPIEGVTARLHRLQRKLTVHVLTADTFGIAEATLGPLSDRLTVVQTGEEKRAYVEQLGADDCVAIGNGTNDVPMLRAVRLGIAVMGPEGTSAAAVMTAAVVCRSVLEALDLLLASDALTATLRP